MTREYDVRSKKPSFQTVKNNDRLELQRKYKFYQIWHFQSLVVMKEQNWRTFYLDKQVKQVASRLPDSEETHQYEHILGFPPFIFCSKTEVFLFDVKFIKVL